MIKLIKADFFKLKKEPIFWLFFFIGIVSALLFLDPFKNATLDEIINKFVIFIGFYIAIFVSIFVGKERSEGTIRNKIICGHSKASIYLSKLIVSSIASILCELIYIVIVLIVGNILNIKSELPLQTLGMCILNSFFVIILYCSIYNFVSMICSEATTSTIMNTVIFVVFICTAFYFGDIASYSKYLEEIRIEADGEEHIISQEPNPKYPGDAKVNFAKQVELINPFGKAMMIDDTEDDILSSMYRNYGKDYLYKILIYSLMEIIVINVGGIYIFTKKELK